MIRRNMLTAACAVLICSISAPALGQLSAVHAPERASTDQQIALSAVWEGSHMLSGAVFAAPSGWRIESARAVSPDGLVRAGALEPLEALPGRYRLRFVPSLNPGSLIQITARTPGLAAHARWSLIPEEQRRNLGVAEPTLREDLRISGDVRILEPISTGNHALLLARTADPIVLNTDQLPDFSSVRAFTLECWLRTVSTDGILLSAWNGEEADSYPLELLVDAHGRVVFYQGQAGDHRSVRSPAPIADGTWHHVAVSHDPERGWTRLLVDGISVDSLHAASPVIAAKPAALGLGGRLAEHPGPRLDAELDQLRFWALARDPSAVRNGMRRPLPEPSLGAAFLEFEPTDAPRIRGTVRTVPSALHFFEPLAELDVSVAGSDVVLTFDASNPDAATYVVERSWDGADFDALAAPLLADPAVRRMQFHDYGAAGRAAFYRVREVDASGAGRLSRTVKVGAGPTAPVWTARLEGNFPNPFNPSTTVRYELDEPQVITVSVWDLSGQRVSLLFEGPQSAGSHEVVFDAGDLPSGAYFVRMRSLQGVQSRQMLLTK